jgi:SagB-type dehydrogenase family enzyme
VKDQSANARPDGTVLPDTETVGLPLPDREGDLSVEEALAARRSVRSYTGDALELEHLSQLLWAAQGVTDTRGYRTSPSAGALYPLEIYAVIGEVVGMTPGVYRYLPGQHQLRRTLDGDQRAELALAALGQSCVRTAPVVLVMTGVYSRASAKYGYRGNQYVHMEVGHAGQNVYLQAVALDLGTVAVGAFQDDEVQSVLRLPDGETPLYLMPVGRPAS